VLVRLADVSPEAAALLRCAYALPALGALAWWERRRFGPRPHVEHGVAVAAGALFAADLVLWHYTIAAVGAGLATVLGNLQVVLVAFAAWALLGERPSRRLLGAVPVVLAGVVLISGVLETGAYGSDPARGVLLGALTSVAYALFILLLRRTNADLRRPAGPLFDATLYSTVACLGAGLVAGRDDLVPGWPAQGWLVVLALSSQVLGWMLISVSLPRVPAAVTSIVLLVQPVGAVLLAMVLLGEDPSALQLLGGLVVLTGVVGATVHRRSPRGEPEPAAA